MNLNEFNGVVWLNGKFINVHSANLHVFTHSLHYSGAVFEGERAYNYKIFKLKEHTERLLESARLMRLKPNFSYSEIYNASTEITITNNLPESYVRPLIWRGSESMNLTNEILSTNILIAAIPISKKSQIPLKVNIARWRKPGVSAMPPQAKSAAHYGMMVVIKDEAHADGFDDSIILDDRGEIAECTTSNVFFVKENKLFTPIADKFLNGITRQVIIQIAKANNINVVEEAICLERLNDFDEAFITGTAVEVKSIQSVQMDNIQINFTENKMTKFLSHKYQELVRS